MQLIDLSPMTLCRNEPHRIDPALADAATEDWMERALHAGSRIGMHDLRPESAKAIARPWTRWTRADRLLYARRLRRRLGREPDAGFPSILYDASRIDEMLRVLKIINARHLVCRVLRERTEIPVAHVIRHPGGMLRSWMNRFAPRFDPGALLDEQRGIVEAIHRADPGFAARSGPAGAMSLEAAKLWSWLHAQEDMLRAGACSPVYRAVVFERLAEAPVPIVRDLYAVLNLEWTPAIEAGVARLTRASSGIADAWRTGLSPAQIGLVERVLGSSDAVRARLEVPYPEKPPRADHDRSDCPPTAGGR